jgi:hypothetical protein
MNLEDGLGMIFLKTSKFYLSQASKNLVVFQNSGGWVSKT